MEIKSDPWILGVESSCDDTSAAVLHGPVLKSNLICSQRVHEQYGGVVPELASRAHLSNIVPVVAQAIAEAGVEPSTIDAVAFTRGPGLLGALLVGTSFAKGFALAHRLKRGIGLQHSRIWPWWYLGATRKLCAWTGRSPWRYLATR